MKFAKWLPWKYLVRRAARKHGFIDPVAVLGWLRRFAQPAEVSEPIELLRAGVVFHARGAVNSRAIQHNLDWVWPYWVERQFDPRDASFVPRAFSLTHINLTHRNWTAVGLPDCFALPVVDPAGLVMPLYDGWTLDVWVIDDKGVRLCPSELKQPVQRLMLDGNPAVETEAEGNGLKLLTRTEMTIEHGEPVCRMSFTAKADRPAWAALVVRPYNAEGVSFVHTIDFEAGANRWLVNERDTVRFDAHADRHVFSTYNEGDVLLKLPKQGMGRNVSCEVGMASAAALFQLQAGEPRKISLLAGVQADLAEAPFSGPTGKTAEALWSDALAGSTRLRIPDERMQFLYDAAVRTLILHSPKLGTDGGDVYPGPYTYKRFWFRDAAFILHGLLCLNMPERVLRVLQQYPKRQAMNGYFHSQEGEWDANGEALWILMRYCQLTGKKPPEEWRAMIEKGAKWIEKKRNAQGPATRKHVGLFPAGFSAEHLGHIDYYYWDDFWGVGGLRAAQWLMKAYGDTQAELAHGMQADRFMKDILRTLEPAAVRLKRIAIPAAPDRRMDAGAVGSLAIGYPLQLCAPDDPRLQDTVRFLMEKCSLDNGFFQDMIHSGINPYLTLHLAQVMLRAENPNFFDLMKRVAELATSTGQWPEAVHPGTLGGCMGDGQHVWAAAEWALMLRNCFVREEGDELLIGAGLPAEWLQNGEELSIGPAPTTFGNVNIAILPEKSGTRIELQGQWHAAPPKIRVKLAGHEIFTPAAGQNAFDVRRSQP